jgi:hypothetical protein
LSTTTPRTNYLNNRDLLREIHLSKNNYCAFQDRQRDHQYDIILPTVTRINQRTVAEARRNRAARLTRETGETVNEKRIPHTDLVFRVMTWEHIPHAPRKIARSTAKKRSIEDIMGLDEPMPEDPLADLTDEPVLDPTHVRVNFPPFFHYRLDDDRVPYIVGKSHWQGDLDTGHYSRDHGDMTRRLAEMFMKLCERYATRSNWRGYSYNEEMRGQALLQLSQIGLQFDESKSSNPFAYYTAAITNSFTRILNIEKKMRNIRDDILEINGLNPSWSRQYADSDRRYTGQVATSSED